MCGCAVEEARAVLCCGGCLCCDMELGVIGPETGRKLGKGGGAAAAAIAGFEWHRHCEPGHRAAQGQLQGDLLRQLSGHPTGISHLVPPVLQLFSTLLIQCCLCSLPCGRLPEQWNHVTHHSGCSFAACSVDAKQCIACRMHLISDTNL